MSFNPNDNNLSPISFNNYEEYFLLYADNELSAAERTSVEQFLVTHPELQTELNLLLSTKLPIEEIKLDNKEALLAHSMKLNNVDEALLLFIDDELPESDKRIVEKRLKADNTYFLQYQALLKTKPTTLDKIAYPHKKELYHHEEKRKFPIYWMRIAAAVVIILGMSVFVFRDQQKPEMPIALEKPPAKTPISVEPGKTEVAIKGEKESPVTTTVVKVGETDDAPNVVRNLKKKVEKKEVKDRPVTPLPVIEEEDIAVKEIKKDQKNIAVNKQEIPQQQTINKPDVTPPSVVAFNNQTASPVTAEQRDIVKTENEKKSSLKGFLRKATRFIERRTNISTTNEDNELLIGAVALKL